jgi:hypothetical protein
MPLSLTARLQLEGCRESVIDSEVGASSVPKSTGKLFPMICGDIFWYASFADHLFEEHSS